MDSGSTAIQPRQQLSLLTPVGPRAISTVGWRNQLAYQHLEDIHAENLSWCDPKCLARVMYHHAIQSNQDRVRQHFGPLFRFALDRRHRLIAREREFRPPYRIVRFRLYSGAITGPEAEALESQLRDMAKRRDLSADRLALALELIDRQRTEL